MYELHINLWPMVKVKISKGVRDHRGFREPKQVHPRKDIYFYTYRFARQMDINENMKVKGSKMSGPWKENKRMFWEVAVLYNTF